jgi:hypothetical protein
MFDAFVEDMISKSGQGFHCHYGMIPEIGPDN